MEQCPQCANSPTPDGNACTLCGERFSNEAAIGKFIGYTALFIGLCIAAYFVMSAVKSTPQEKAAKQQEQESRTYIVQAQETIRKKLKDPSSADFRNVMVVRYGSAVHVCGEVNSKNSLGGYAGFQKFVAAGRNTAYLQEEVSDFANLWNNLCR